MMLAAMTDGMSRRKESRIDRTPTRDAVREQGDGEAMLNRIYTGLEGFRSS